MQGKDSFDLLRARMFELWERRNDGRSGTIGFMTPFEAEELSRIMPKEAREAAVFFGGHENAERVMLGFTSLWEDAPDFPVDLILYRFPSDAVFSHRDVLGALMGEGIKRSCLGDILVRPGEAAVFTLSSMAKHLSEVKSIGRYAVTATLSNELPDGYAVLTEKHRDSLASLRLDCILACILNLSRQKAEELLRRKEVQLDGRVVEEGDKKVSLPATLSVRHYGKYRLLAVVGETKKGRLLLEYEKYL